MNNYNMKYLKSKLYQLVRMDYGFDFYHMQDINIKFSFYHLNSVYNSLCTTIKYSDYWCEPYVNWQYATPNKRIQKIVTDIVLCIRHLTCTPYKGIREERIKKIEDEIEYYKGLSQAIFKAKYSTEVMSHTIN